MLVGSLCVPRRGLENFSTIGLTISQRQNDETGRSVGHSWPPKDPSLGAAISLAPQPPTSPTRRSTILHPTSLRLTHAHLHTRCVVFLSLFDPPHCSRFSTSLCPPSSYPIHLQSISPAFSTPPHFCNPPAATFFLCLTVAPPAFSFCRSTPPPHPARPICGVLQISSSSQLRSPLACPCSSVYFFVSQLFILFPSLSSTLTDQAPVGS